MLQENKVAEKLDDEVNEREQRLLNGQMQANLLTRSLGENKLFADRFRRMVRHSEQQCKAEMIKLASDQELADLVDEVDRANERLSLAKYSKQAVSLHVLMEWDDADDEFGLSPVEELSLLTNARYSVIACLHGDGQTRCWPLKQVAKGARLRAQTEPRPALCQCNSFLCADID